MRERRPVSDTVRPKRLPYGTYQFLKHTILRATTILAASWFCMFPREIPRATLECSVGAFFKSDGNDDLWSDWLPPVRIDASPISAPSGAQYDSPGQRPGSPRTTTELGLKARHNVCQPRICDRYQMSMRFKGIAILLDRPYRANRTVLARFPGRCPGLP